MGYSPRGHRLKHRPKSFHHSFLLFSNIFGPSWKTESIRCLCYTGMWSNSKGSERLTAILLFQNWLVVPCVPCELLPLKEQKEFLRIRQLESKHISLFLKSSYNPNDTQIPLTYTPPKWCGGLGLEYRCPPDLYFWVRNIPVLIILDITYTLHLLLAHICFSYKEKGWHFSAMTVTKNFPLQLPRCNHTTACALCLVLLSPFSNLGRATEDQWIQSH